MDSSEKKSAGKRLILASASPRRRELLSRIGMEYETRVSRQKEVYTAVEPAEIVQELALQKAENVTRELPLEAAGQEEPAGFSGIRPEASGVSRNAVPKSPALHRLTVLGADTIVTVDGRILGKPADEAEAFRMLDTLQGRTHQVYTGVAFLDFDGNGKKAVLTHAEETTVFVHAMDADEIRRYIAAGESMDKAGAYGIQGQFAAFIDRIEGDYYNVMGLPTSYVYRQLKELGF